MDAEIDSIKQAQKNKERIFICFSGGGSPLHASSVRTNVSQTGLCGGRGGLRKARTRPNARSDNRSRFIKSRQVRQALTRRSPTCPSVIQPGLCWPPPPPPPP